MTLKLSFTHLLLSAIFIILGSCSSECGISYCKSCDPTTKLCLQCEDGLQFSREELQCLSVSDCPLGQFKTSRNSTCSNCHPSCKSCFGNNSYQCYECVDGYTFLQDYYSNNLICGSCSVKNCFRCDHLGYCSLCQDGYYLNQTNSACLPCSVGNCQDCTANSQECSLCFSSYELSSDQTECTLKGDCALTYYQDSLDICNNKCDPSCTHCYDGGNTGCYDCADGYYLSNQICLPCDKSCSTCQYTSTYCTSCPLNTSAVLNGNRCDQNCPDGQYASTDNLCLPCSPNCSSCLSYNQCLNCADISQYTIVNGQCQSKCSSGQFNQLSKKDYSYVISYQFKLISQTLNCQPCMSSCNQCVLFANKCVSCKAGLILYGSTCVPKCPDSQYLETNTLLNIQRCLPCPFPCSKCTSANYCTECQDQFILKDGVCTYSGKALNTCKESQVTVDNVCFDECPTGLIQQGTSCQCNYDCNFCIFYLTSLEVECVQCQNYADYSYKGQCFDQCDYPLFEITKTYQPSIQLKLTYNACTDSCPSGMLSQISVDRKQCVTKCSSGFTLYQNLCLKLPCQKGESFDQVSYFADLDSKQPITDMTKYCKPCDISCSTCTGPKQTDCMQCASSYVLQKKSDATQSWKLCQKSCDPGFVAVQAINVDLSTYQQCIICYTNCQACAVGYFSIASNLLTNTTPTSDSTTNNNLLNCYAQCPSGTTANPATSSCSINISASVTFSSAVIFQGLYSAQASITALFHVNSIITISSSLPVSCVVNELQYNLLMNDQSNTGTDHLIKALIPSGQLQDSSTYTITCTTTINSQPITATSSLSTFGFITGNFYVNTTKGFAMNETFKFSIQGFSLSKSIPVNTYTMPFRLSAELLSSLNIRSNTTIFTSNAASTNDQWQKQLNSPFNVLYTFPQISSKQEAKIYLTFSFLQTLSWTFQLSVTLNPFIFSQQLQPTQISPIISSIINNIQSSEDSNSIKFTTSSLSNFALQLQITNSAPRLNAGNKQLVAQQKMLSNSLNAQISCDALVDCSSNGSCKTNITSYYSKCDCKNGYSGETCAWRTIDLEKVQLVFENSLPNMKSSIDTLSSESDDQAESSLDLISESLTNIAAIRDVFNKNITTQFLSILNDSTLYSNNLSQYAAENLLSANDQALDILRKAQSFQNVTPADIKAIKDNFNAALYSYQSSSLPDGANYTFSLQNIEGVIQDLSNAGYSNSNTVGLSTKTSSWSVNIPTSVFGNLGSQIFAQVIMWPLDLQELDHDYSQSEFNLLASSIADVTLRKKSSQTAQFTVSGVSSPISIKIHRELLDSQLQAYSATNYSMQCQYQLSNGTWTSQGLNTTYDSAKLDYTCSSDHLTSFSIGIQSYHSAANLPRLSNQFQAFGIVNMCLVLILMHGIAFASFLKFKLNQKRNSNSNTITLVNNNLNFINNNNKNCLNNIAQANNNQNNILSLLGMEGQTTQKNIIKLDGVKIGLASEAPPAIVGLPQGTFEERKKPESKKNTQLPIQFADISDTFLIKSVAGNGQISEKFAQNMARRAKEAEIDLAGMPQQPHTNEQSREINLIPISTFYRSEQNGIATPEKSTLNNEEGNLKQITNSPGQDLQINVDIPEGIPIDLFQESAKIDKENNPEQPQQQQQQIIHSNSLENDRFQTNPMIIYHPIFAFSQPLPYCSIQLRICLFFEAIALVEALTLAFAINDNTKETEGIQLSKAKDFSQVFALVLISRCFIHYILPTFLSFLSFFEKICFKEAHLANSMYCKYACVLAITIYALISFLEDSKYFASSTQIGQWFLSALINFFLDYIVIEYIVIKIHRKWCTRVLVRIIKKKNLDELN